MSSRTQSTRRHPGLSRLAPRPKSVAFHENDGRIDPGPEPPARLVREIRDRIEAVRAVKRITGNNLSERELDATLEPVEQRTSANRTELTFVDRPRKVKSDDKVSGVCAYKKPNGETAYRARIDFKSFRANETHDCAIAAMIARLGWEEKYRSEITKLHKCRPELVWNKWGCTCGKHERPKDNSEAYHMRSLTERTKMTGDNRVERMRIFGRRLTNAREKSERSRRGIAEELGIGESTVHYYETGGACPSVFVAARLAKVYGVSLDELVRGL